MEDIFYKFKIYRILSTCIYWAVYNNGKNDTSLIFWQSFPVYSWYSSWLRDLIKFSKGPKENHYFYYFWRKKSCLIMVDHHNMNHYTLAETDISACILKCHGQWMLIFDLLLGKKVECIASIRLLKRTMKSLSDIYIILCTHSYRLHIGTLSVTHVLMSVCPSFDFRPIT